MSPARLALTTTPSIFPSAWELTTPVKAAAPCANTVVEFRQATTVVTSASAAIATLIDSREGGVCLKIRSRLEQMGFRIEAGVRCDQGLVLSAYRQGLAQMEQAA